MKHEPSRFEIFLTRLAFFLYGRSVYRSFAERLPLHGGGNVLDFGCGMGTVAYYVAPKLPRGRLTCLDVSRRWLEACRKTLRRCGNVDFLQSDCPSFADESFDAAYCHFVLHELSERELERVIPALARSLKAGGALVFREPLEEMEKVNVIKRLTEENGLLHKDSRVTDIPLMGNALESVYRKK